MDIAAYVEFMAGGGRGPGGDELRRRARDRLLSSGWTLYKKAKCDGRQELRYRAPHGASYISLIVACKKFQQFSTAPPRTTAAAARGKPGVKRKSTAAAARGKPGVKRKSMAAAARGKPGVKRKSTTTSSGLNTGNGRGCNEASPELQWSIAGPPEA